MDLRTEGVPTRRVLKGDDGAPLDDDRVLALALRWGDRALTLDHVKPGVERAPIEGVAVRWEDTLPVIAMGEGVKAWVERGGQWVEPGRRLALELGEVLVVHTGALVLEARLQRRSEKAGPGRRESLFFGLVVTHCLMIFAAIAVALVITPRVDDTSLWGAPGLVLRLASTPFSAVPTRKTPQLEQRVKEVVAKATVRDFAATTPQRTQTAMSAIQRLLGGGGGGGIFERSGLGGGINAALEGLGQGAGNQADNGGLSGISGRNLGGGIDHGGLSLGGIGPGRLPGGGPPGGLRGHKVEVVVCRHCGEVPPGYDRELILKVVRRHQNEIRFCYEAELQKSPQLAGKVTVAWTIGPSGSVDLAQIAESGLGNENVEACIVSRVRNWSFPEPQGGQEVAITFPWVFQVAGDGE